MEDKLLVLRCKGGSKEALQEIYTKYRDDLMTVAISLLNDMSAAEDIVHDVFVSFAERIREFQLKGALKGYLATCVANRARNKNKAKQSQAAESDTIESTTSESKQPHQSIMCNEELEILRSAMACLPYEQREVIMLHMRGNVSLRRIAKIQGLSANTVKSRYRYGLNKLRTILDGQMKNETY